MIIFKGVSQYEFDTEENEKYTSYLEIMKR